MSLLGGNEKARFIGLDSPGSANFVVQYNPKEFALNKAVSWSDGGAQGNDAGLYQYQKGSPMTASFDLIFDTTASQNENVQEAWVSGLLALTNPVEEPTKGEPTELGKKRPRTLMFQWGRFSMPCVIESIKVQYLMFSNAGNPVRARCSVALKEWRVQEDFEAETGSASNGMEAVQLVQAKGGETLVQISAAFGIDVRVLARFNGIVDPLADLTGKTLRIPKGAGKAAAKAAGKAASKAASKAAGKAAGKIAAKIGGKSAAKKSSPPASSPPRAPTGSGGGRGGGGGGGIMRVR
ncbi:MAG: hypothetical protein RLZZ299_2629 [Pseudomonadota bacterium]